MEDVNAIHRIFKNLKYEMDNNGWVYQWHLGDEPIKVTHKFYPPVSSEEFQLFEKYFPNMKLSFTLMLNISADIFFRHRPDRFHIIGMVPQLSFPKLFSYFRKTFE